MINLSEVQYMPEELKTELTLRLRSLLKTNEIEYDYLPAERKKYIFSIDVYNNCVKAINELSDWLTSNNIRVSGMDDITRETVIEFLSETYPAKGKLSAAVSCMNKLFAFDIKAREVTE